MYALPSLQIIFPALSAANFKLCVSLTTVCFCLSSRRSNVRRSLSVCCTAGLALTTNSSSILYSVASDGERLASCRRHDKAASFAAEAPTMAILVHLSAIATLASSSTALRRLATACSTAFRTSSTKAREREEHAPVPVCRSRSLTSRVRSSW